MSNTNLLLLIITFDRAFITQLT